MSKPAAKQECETKSTRRTLETRVIGLTGNIACGKSSVARLLENAGFPVIDADQVSRDVTAPGEPALEATATEFGDTILTPAGELDRAKLRKIVFDDSEKRKKLEAIMHPAIQKRTQEVLARYFSQGKTTIIYEASLLFEAKREKDFAGMLVVTCPERMQVERILSRDPSATRALALQIARSQMPQGEKARKATWVIENNGSLDDLEKKVRAWIELLTPPFLSAR